MSLPDDFADRLWGLLSEIRHRMRSAPYRADEWLHDLHHDLLPELQMLSEGLDWIVNFDLAPLRRKHELALIQLRRDQEDELAAELAIGTEDYVRDNLIDPPSIANGNENEIDQRIREIIAGVLVRNEEIDDLLAKEIAIRRAEDLHSLTDDVAFA